MGDNIGGNTEDLMNQVLTSCEYLMWQTNALLQKIGEVRLRGDKEELQKLVKPLALYERKLAVLQGAVGGGSAKLQKEIAAAMELSPLVVRQIEEIIDNNGGFPSSC